MSPRRRPQPEAVIGDDDYLFVKHTHDIELATLLMAQLLVREGWFEYSEAARKHRLGDPRQLYLRIRGALPGTEAAAMGWRCQVDEEDPPRRGTFPAVVFR
jgi:hypothetical protein